MDIGPSDIAADGPPDGPRPDEAADGSPSFVFTDKLPLVTDPESLTAESIRSLRAILLAHHLQDGRRSLAICAPSAGTGCSFLSANLAISMAQIGVNTLLVDANLRAPSIQDYIMPSQPVAGLADCLRDDALPMGNVVCAVQPSLSVLYAGNIDENTHDAIGGSVFKSVLSSCLRDYDLTIIDTPPASRYADAYRIASLARYAMVVACRVRTYLKDVKTLLYELENARTTVVGTYLNDY